MQKTQINFSSIIRVYVYKSHASAILLLLLLFVCSCNQHYFLVDTRITTNTPETELVTKLIKDFHKEKFYILHIGNKMWGLNYAQVDRRKSEINGQLFALEPTDLQVAKNANLAVGKFACKGKSDKIALSQVHIYVEEFSIDNMDISVPLSAIKQIVEFKTDQDKECVASTCNSMSVIAASMVLAVLVIRSAAKLICNCPYVDLIVNDHNYLQGTLFPGAISKSLQRADNLIIKNPPSGSTNGIALKISNQLPEIEYIDQLALYEVNTGNYQEVALNEEHRVIAYNVKKNLLEATTTSGLLTTNTMVANDSLSFSFNQEGNDNQLDEVFLTFDKKGLQDSCILILNGKQTKWMEVVGEQGFQLLGNQFPRWVKKMDAVDPIVAREKMKIRGLSLNVYLKENNNWNYVGSYENAGTMTYRNLALKVNLNKVKGAAVELKLTCAHNFWEINYAHISDEYSEAIQLHPLKMASAYNQENCDTYHQLQKADHYYAEQPHTGDYMNVTFEKPSSTATYLVLNAEGYYHHVRNYTNKPNLKLLYEVRKNTLSSHQLSRALKAQVMAAHQLKDNAAFH